MTSWRAAEALLQLESMEQAGSMAEGKLGSNQTRDREVDSRAERSLPPCSQLAQMAQQVEWQAGSLALSDLRLERWHFAEAEEALHSEPVQESQWARASSSP